MYASLNAAASFLHIKLDDMRHGPRWDVVNAPRHGAWRMYTMTLGTITLLALVEQKTK